MQRTRFSYEINCWAVQQWTEKWMDRARPEPLLNRNKWNGFLEGCRVLISSVQNTEFMARRAHTRLRLMTANISFPTFSCFIKTPNGPRRCAQRPVYTSVYLWTEQQRRNDCVPVAVLFSIFLELQPVECLSIFMRWETVAIWMFQKMGGPTWTSAVAVENRLTICIYRCCTRTHRVPSLRTSRAYITKSEREQHKSGMQIFTQTNFEWVTSISALRCCQNPFCCNANCHTLYWILFI